MTTCRVTVWDKRDGTRTNVRECGQPVDGESGGRLCVWHEGERVRLGGAG